MLFYEEVKSSKEPDTLVPPPSGGVEATSPLSPIMESGAGDKLTQLQVQCTST